MLWQHNCTVPQLQAFIGTDLAASCTADLFLEVHLPVGASYSKTFQ